MSPQLVILKHTYTSNATETQHITYLCIYMCVCTWVCAWIIIQEKRGHEFEREQREGAWKKLRVEGEKWGKWCKIYFNFKVVCVWLRSVVLSEWRFHSNSAIPPPLPQLYSSSWPGTHDTRRAWVTVRVAGIRFKSWSVWCWESDPGLCAC